MAEILWKERKRTFLGLPLSFTVYRLTDDVLTIKTGLFNVREEEVRLYRIMDITLHQTFGERILRIGTIHCCSADKSTPEFDIKRIKHPREVRTLLSDLVEKKRSERYVTIREEMDGDNEDEHHD